MKRIKFHIMTFLGSGVLRLSTPYKMKKILFILSICLFVLSTVQSQDQTLTAERSYHLKGDQQIIAGIGLLNPTSFAFSVFGGTGAGSPSPSFNLQYEYGMSDYISFGAFVNYYRVSSEGSINISQIDETLLEDILSDPCVAACLIGVSLGCDCEANVTERVNVFTIGGKLSYHFRKWEGIETFSSVYLGYSFNRRKTITESALDAVLGAADISTNVPTLLYYGSAGMKYYVTEKIGIGGEIGYGNTHILLLSASYRIR